MMAKEFDRISKQGEEAIDNWLYENNYTFHKNSCASASLIGSLKLLKILRQKGYPWDSDTSTCASISNNLEILCWVLENGCPYDERICINAAFNGCYEILEYAHNFGCPWNIKVYTSVILGSRLHNLKFLKDLDESIDPIYAVDPNHFGHMMCLSYALENNCPYDRNETRQMIKEMLMTCEI